MNLIILTIVGIVVGWNLRTIYSIICYYIDERKAKAEEHNKFKNRYKTYLFWTSDKAVMK